VYAGTALAQFCHYYPGLYRLPWPETRDGIIPARLFFMLYAELAHVTARIELSTTLAVGAAIRAALGGDDDSARDALMGLIDRALPGEEA
jgi:hypothetical protein